MPLLQDAQNKTNPEQPIFNLRPLSFRERLVMFFRLISWQMLVIAGLLVAWGVSLVAVGLFWYQLNSRTQDLISFAKKDEELSKQMRLVVRSLNDLYSQQEASYLQLNGKIQQLQEAPARPALKTEVKPEVDIEDAPKSSVKVSPLKMGDAKPFDKAPSSLKGIVNAWVIQGHLYSSKNPRDSFVLINNQAYSQGDRIAGEGASQVNLLRILDDRIVLGYQGETYFLLKSVYFPDSGS